MKYSLFVIMLVVIGMRCPAQDYSNQILDRYSRYLQYDLETQEAGLAFLSRNLLHEHEGIDSTLLRGRMLTGLHVLRDVSVYFSNKNPNSDSLEWESLEKEIILYVSFFENNSHWSLCQPSIAKDLRDIVIVLRGRLKHDVNQRIVNLLKLHKTVGQGVGSDLIFVNELMLHVQLLTGDTTFIRKSSNLIKNVMIEGNSNVFPDCSYIGESGLDMYGEGKELLIDLLRIGVQLKDTPWEFNRKQIGFLTDFAIDGFQYMARGIHPIPTLERRSNSDKTGGSADLRRIIPLLQEIDSDSKMLFNILKDWQDGKYDRNGQFFWPQANVTANHLRDFSLFIQAVPSAGVRGDGRQYKLNEFGATYFIAEGNEYPSALPVENGAPGQTLFPNVSRVNMGTGSFNVNNGTSGLTIMNIDQTNAEKNQYLTGRKFWGMHDGFMVCLLGGLSGNFRGNAITTLDQCARRGDVTVSFLDQKLSAGRHRLNNPRWIHHGNFAYIFFPFYNNELNVDLTTAPANGFFKCGLDHGHAPKEGYTGYVVTYAQSPMVAQALAASPKWEIHQNHNDCQAIAFNDGVVMAAFYKPFHLQNKKISLKADKACLLLIEKDKMWVTSLSGSDEEVTIEYNGIERRLNSSEKKY
jgi:hypothetical protein